MAEVTVRGIQKTFGEVKALDDVSLDFAEGKFYALLGPSGSGKTTLLRLIAGFEFPDAGQITIGGEPVENLPVEKRDIGMVFQNYALFPNMNVFDNVGFGLSVRGVDNAEIKKRVGETLELVRLTGFDDRRPHQMSGGQRQRVALARAIITRPRVLLLDEPLSALDRSLRVEMEIELKRIQRDIGITTIFVTHDQEEALTMSDHIGILDHGKLIQQGPPLEVYEKPNSAFSAKFLGDANLLEGKIEQGRVELSNGSHINALNTPSNEGGKVTVSVRPEKITIKEQASSVPPENSNVISGLVQRHIFAGNSLTYLVEWHGMTLRVFEQNLTGHVIGEGTAVTLSWLPANTVVVEQ